MAGHRIAPSLLVLALVAALLASPTGLAQRQAPSLHAASDDALTVADAPSARVLNVTITYRPALPDNAATEGVRVELTLDGLPSWARLAGEIPEARLFPQPREEASVVVGIPVEVLATARAGARANFVLIATSDATALNDAAETELPMVIEVRDNRSTHPDATSNRGAMPPPAANAPRAPSGMTQGSDPREAAWQALAQNGGGLTVQSAHNEGFTGGETFAILLFGAAGAYAGAKLRGRFVE